jgi:hypothetical protein
VPYLIMMGRAPAIKIVMITNIIPSFSFFSNMFTPIKIVVSGFDESNPYFNSETGETPVLQFYLVSYIFNWPTNLCPN